MPITYFMTDVDSDINVGSQVWGNVADTTEGGTTAVIDINPGVGATVTAYFITPAGSPGVLGFNTGDVTVNLNVTAVGGNTSITVGLQRINSSGTVQNSSSTSALVGGVGLKQFVFTDPALGTWASGDRLQVSIAVADTSSMAASQITISLNDADDTIETPFDPVLGAALIGGILLEGKLLGGKFG